MSVPFKEKRITPEIRKKRVAVTYRSANRSDERRQLIHAVKMDRKYGDKS